MNTLAFDTFALNDNKFQLQHDNYVVPPGSGDNAAAPGDGEELLVYQGCRAAVAPPHICTWDYLTKAEVAVVLGLKGKAAIRRFIEKKMKKRPKGFSKIVFRELMYTVVKFCKRSNFSLEQTGAVLAQFYLTHIFFTSSLDMGADKLYNYFRDLQICHSLPFPPSSIKLFNLEEIRSVMTYFCRLYLRNLPIIRVLSLPNFTLLANYYIEPEPKRKKGKDKKEKKNKKKKT